MIDLQANILRLVLQIMEDHPLSIRRVGQCSFLRHISLVCASHESFYGTKVPVTGKKSPMCLAIL